MTWGAILRPECRVMACAWIEENKGREDVAFGHWSNDMKSLPMECINPMKNYKGNPSTFLQSPFIHSHSFMSKLFPSSHNTTTNQRLALSYSSFLSLLFPFLFTQAIILQSIPFYLLLLSLSFSQPPSLSTSVPLYQISL